MRKYKDITKQRFGQFLVLGRDVRTDAKGRAYWVCQCECGRFLSVRGDQLRRSVSTKCTDCHNRAGRKSAFIEEGEKINDYKNLLG